MVKKIEVSDSQYNSVRDENKGIVQEFLKQSTQLSDQTLRQYESALRIYFYWIKENASDKGYYEIKSRDFLFYQNHLVDLGLSSSAIRLKRSAVSSLNNYIEVYYQEDYPLFRNYVGKGIPAPKHEFVNKKEPLTMSEYDSLCNVLEERELWQQLAYLKFSFSSGCRRAEARQILKEVVEYDPKVKTISVTNDDGVKENKISEYHMTHEVRCKGSSKSGKIRKLSFDKDAMDSIKRWLDERGEDDCLYVFATKRHGKMQQVSEGAFNSWCNNIFEEIVGRRVHPHMLRESRATSLVVEQGKDIKVVQSLLGHKSSVTSEIYVIRNDEGDADEAFV